MHQSEKPQKQFSHRMVVALCCLAFLYIFTRLSAIFLLEPHNDEVIYTQYAVHIAENWEKNKFISMNGSTIDYIEPLSLWLMSLVAAGRNDPVRAIRLLAMAFGALHLTSLFFFIRKIWNAEIALLSSFFIVTSATYLYFDSIGIMEVFVYSIGTTFLLFTYLSLEKRYSVFSLVSALIGCALLLTKASGKLWLVAALFLPLFLLLNNKQPHDHWKASVSKLYEPYVKVVIICSLAIFLHYIIIPIEFSAHKIQSFQAGLIRTFDEVLRTPLHAWKESVQFYGNHVLGTEFSYLLLPVLLLITALGIALWRRRSRALGTYALFLLFIAGCTLPLILLAKMQYVRYYAMNIALFYTLLSAALMLIPLKKQVRCFAISTAILLVFVLRVFDTYLPLIHWKYTDLAWAETPAGWAKGLGMRDTVKMLSKLEEGTVLLDPQWGHPRTAIEVYNSFYPQLNLQSLPGKQEIIDIIRASHSNVYILLDGRMVGDRPWADQILNDPELCQNKQIVSKQYRTTKVHDSYIALCTTKKNITYKN